MAANPEFPASGAGALSRLNERSREIFRNIVETYLASGEPVGSRHLSRILAVPLSPASVRNVMQDLEELGLVYSPHTSAGRLPTEFGLRFFVDSLLQIGDLTELERGRIEAQLRAVSRERSMEEALSEAGLLLSGLTRGACVVLTSKDNSRLKQIEFVRLEPEKALAILVSEDGSVENRILPVAADLPASALIEAGNYLNARLRGRTSVASARRDRDFAALAAQAELDVLTARLVDAGLAIWAGPAGAAQNLIVRGQANLLEDLTAMADLERIRLLFDDLETKSEVIDLLARAEEGEGVRIFIGSENKLFSLSGLVDDRRALPRFPAPDRRRARRDRPHAPELCARGAHGGLYRAGHGPALRRRLSARPHQQRNMAWLQKLNSSASPRGR